MTYRKLTYIKL